MLLLNIWFLGNYPQERLFLPLKLKSFIQVFSSPPTYRELKVTFQEREREFSQEFSPLMENRGITYQSHCHKNKTNGCMYCQYIKYRSIVICGTIWLICCVCGERQTKCMWKGQLSICIKWCVNKVSDRASRGGTPVQQGPGVLKRRNDIRWSFENSLL